MNHPLNPTPQMLDELWLAAMADWGPAQRQYFDCLKVATYSASSLHLQHVRAKLRTRRGL